MLLSLSLNRLFSGQPSRRRHLRAASAAVEATEPRLCLSATTPMDGDFGNDADFEYEELELVWYDAWWFESDEDIWDDWSDEFDVEEEFAFETGEWSSWKITDDWYDLETTWESDTTWEDDWSDEAWDDGFVVDDFWFEHDVVVWDWADESDWGDTSFDWDSGWWYEDVAVVETEGRPFGNDALMPIDEDDIPFDDDGLIPADEFVLYDEFVVEVYETVEFDFVDFDFAEEFDTHTMSEDFESNMIDDFTCELFFIDDVEVADILTTDSFAADDEFVFAADVFEVAEFDAVEDDFVADEFVAEEIVFVDEFVFVDPGESFVDDITESDWDDLFVDASFDDAGFASIDDFIPEDAPVETDFELVVSTDTESVVVDVVVLDDTLKETVSDDFIAEVESVVIDAIADVHALNEDFVSLTTDVDGKSDASDSLVSEIVDVVVEVDSESIGGKDTPVVTSVTVVSELVDSTDGADDILDFEEALDDSASPPKGEPVDDIVTSPSLLFVGLSPDEAGSTEALVGDAEEFTSNSELAINESGDGSVAVVASLQQTDQTVGEGLVADALPEGHVSSSEKIQRKGPQTRSVVRDVLTRKLQTAARKGRVADTAASQTVLQPTANIPVTEQNAVRLSADATPQSSTASATQRQTSQTQFSFRLSRAAAQASRLTTQSDGQSISYDATLLAFEHSALSMQLDGLTQPVVDGEFDDAIEQRDSQPGYAQMVSAAGTLAIGGAAGVHFTQRRGWSMLLRCVRALIGRI